MVCRYSHFVQLTQEDLIKMKSSMAVRHASPGLPSAFGFRASCRG